MATTLHDYKKHIDTIKANPDVATIIERESIHRDEFDAFQIARMNNGDEFIIGYSDPGHGFDATYSTYPLGEIPMLKGHGCWFSMSEYSKKKRAA